MLLRTIAPFPSLRSDPFPSSTCRPLISPSSSPRNSWAPTFWPRKENNSLKVSFSSSTYDFFFQFEKQHIIIIEHFKNRSLKKKIKIIPNPITKRPDDFCAVSLTLPSPQFLVLHAHTRTHAHARARTHTHTPLEPLKDKASSLQMYELLYILNLFIDTFRCYLL